LKSAQIPLDETAWYNIVNMEISKIDSVKALSSVISKHLGGDAVASFVVTGIDVLDEWVKSCPYEEYED